MGYVNLCPAREPVGLTYEPLAAPIADTPQCHGFPGGSQHVRCFQNRGLTAVIFADEQVNASKVPQLILRQAAVPDYLNRVKHTSTTWRPAPAPRADQWRRVAGCHAVYKLPSSAAVSDMRLEKPHSLSYQPMTRVNAPSTTAVCDASKVHDAGQWLKSMLTSGLVL